MGYVKKDRLAYMGVDFHRIFKARRKILWLPKRGFDSRLFTIIIVSEDNALAGAVVAIQTFGDFLGLHPHLHILCTDRCSRWVKRHIPVQGRQRGEVFWRPGMVPQKTAGCKHSPPCALMYRVRVSRWLGAMVTSVMSVAGKEKYWTRMTPSIL